MSNAQKDEFEIRQEKIKELIDLGIQPYPYSFEKTANSTYLKENADKLLDKEFSFAGRIVLKRVFGKLIFASLRDEYGDLQIAIEKNKAKVHQKDLDALKFFKKYCDIGDFIGVKGPLIKTKTGEPTILVKELYFLSKGLRQLPEKWHGLQDKELMYRQRYLHLLSSLDARWLFKQRTKIIYEIRKFLNDRGFIEFETPILQPIYGGAYAKPFKTYANALETDLYLRISDELYLKRLLVGGYERVYEFSRDFRNEGIDRLHYPEFLALEAYAAYWDYNDMMKLAEDMFSHLVKELYSSYKLEYQGEAIDFTPPFKRISYIDELSNKMGINILTAQDETIREKAKEIGLAGWNTLDRWRLVDKLFDALVGDEIKNPTFVIDHPKEISPLAKVHREKPERVERFELFVLGMEVANAFSELNDPQDQRKRFQEQAKQREKGNMEIPPEIDYDFLNALEYGMPPAAGIGFGIDRIIMLLTDAHSIRDVILFPQLKPKEED